MGLVERFDRKLESTVEDAFARVFGGAVVPAEVEDMLRREAADQVRTLPGGHRLAPNEYVITLSGSDHEKVLADSCLTADTFAKHLTAYLGEQGWQTYGEVVVRFERSTALHTGQVRARGVVNPDATLGPDPDPEHPAPRQSALTAEPGVSAMSDNPTYRGGQGQGQDRPGDEYYDDRYGRPQDDQRGQDPRYGDQRGYPQQGEPNYQQRPGYGDQGGYQQGYEQRPPAGYGGPQQGQGGYDQGYRQGQGGYGGPQGGNYGGQQPDYDYGRGGQRDDYGRQPYPDQGGYGRQDQGRPDYGQPDYGRYGDQQRGDYDYGQQQPGQGGYGGYDQGYRPSAGPATVTLQLDDGSGRTYQLREGANVIGRGQDAQFRLPDTGVSRRHLEIRWDGQVALLSDLNSTNGTTVNNAPVQEWQLADGDVIRLGHSEIVVRVH